MFEALLYSLVSELFQPYRGRAVLCSPRVTLGCQWSQTHFWHYVPEPNIRLRVLSRSMKITVYHFRWEGSMNKNQHLESGHSSSLNSSRTTLRYSIHFVKCACRIKSCYSHQQPNWPYSKISPLLPPPLISSFLLSGITSQISYMHPSYCHRMCIGENANKFFFMFVLLDISLIYSMQSIYLLTRQIPIQRACCALTGIILNELLCGTHRAQMQTVQ